MSRSAELDLTELTAGAVRILDPRVATLQGSIVRGTSVGRTEVQVFIIINDNKIISAKKLRLIQLSCIFSYLINMFPFYLVFNA